MVNAVPSSPTVPSPARVTAVAVASPKCSSGIPTAAWTWAWKASAIYETSKLHATDRRRVDYPEPIVDATWGNERFRAARAQ